MPLRTAIAAPRSNSRESVMKSSVLNATSTPARSRIAPISIDQSSVSSLPPGASMKVIDTGTPAAAISSASFHDSVPCWMTTRKPNSSRSRSTVAMSLWRWVWC